MICVRLNLRILTYFILGLAGPLSAQTPGDTVRVIAGIDRDVLVHDALLERAVWPGYHFSQLGVMYVIPRTAKIAAHWPAAAPPGMQTLEGFGNVLWTDTGTVRWQAGLPVASLPVGATQSRASVAGTAMHEAFHAFEVTQRRTGRRFGSGENSMVTSRYPVFDVENEAAFAVEANLLREAVLAPTDAVARAQARQFLAVRMRRQSRLDSTFVNYEKAAELHEGLAQYTLLRGLAALGEANPRYRAGALNEKNVERDLLANTLARSDLSVRRRAYATGSFMGLLLDRLSTPSWKTQVINNDEWLQDILATVVGRAAVTQETERAIAAALPRAIATTNKLRASRVQQRDSVLAVHDLLVAVDPVALGAHFEWCGFDPQNLLPTGTGSLLHMRMLNLCTNGKKVGAIYQGAVEDEASGRIQTSVAASSLQLSAEGNVRPIPNVGEAVVVKDVVVKTEDLEISWPRAVLIRGQKLLLVIPMR